TGQSMARSGREAFAQQPRRLDRHADAFGNDRMRLAGGVPDGKNSFGNSRADSGANRTRGQPPLDHARAAERVTDAATGLFDVCQHRFSRRRAWRPKPAALELVPPDATGEVHLLLIGVNHPAIATWKNKQRHEIGGQTGIVEARFKSEQVRAARRASGRLGRQLSRLRKSSSRPSRRNRGRFVAEMYSPHTLRRGNRDFSMTATRQPARASSSPAVAPPGPPPMTIASNVCAIFLRGSWLAAEVSRDKTVSEQASGFFLQLPASGRRP